MTSYFKFQARQNWFKTIWFKAKVTMCRWIKNFSKIEGDNTISTALPSMLIQHISASTVLQFKESTHAFKEFWVQCLKCRVTLTNLCHCSHHGAHLPNFILYAARSLFQ
ncbi:hypothetical protein RIF29_39912 [Crotalaria pallida]|uniref:Uncharacterized protein n=1 Tax=Crotalaria pallida TaxID=3830 RepID=A0AAN9E2K6_CROPI